MDKTKQHQLNEDLHQYPLHEELLKLNFDKNVQSYKNLFQTNASNLFETYLANIPQKDRQLYNCNCCKSFINKYGNLVVIDSDGTKKSAIWNLDVTPLFFRDAVKAVLNEVMRAKVVGVFLHDEEIIGTTGNINEWTHLSLDYPSNLTVSTRVKTVGQQMAEKKEEFRMLMNAVLEYSGNNYNAVDNAIQLINSESLYRGDRISSQAIWFRNVVQSFKLAKTTYEKQNVVWLAVATAPTGFTHVRSSVFGSLLQDIVDGYSTNSIISRFNDKMNPSNFMRSQSEPTENSIAQAEKLIMSLGLADSLERKYATMDEIPKEELLWEDNSSTLKKVVRDTSSGVFGHIKTQKNNTEHFIEVNLPISVMTWEKFKRTILPFAESIEAMVDDETRLMALVNAKNNDSSNILNWDNKFSWYYHGGVDAEIRQRVEDAGGRYENNDIRCSLIWNNYTDLDLHCLTPKGNHIYFGNKRDFTGGYLDIDMNAGGRQTTKPVENIRWENAREGVYEFFVDNFSDRNNGDNPFKVELEVEGKVYTHIGHLGYGGKKQVFKFIYKKGKPIEFIGENKHNTSSSSDWNVQLGTFLKVKAVTPSPNMWGKNPNERSGNHTFFLLDGLKDESEGKGRGFFNEMLQSDLRQIRKTLEAYTAQTPIYGIENADAFGLGYSKDQEWNLTLKVKSDNSTRIIKIDRWD